MPVGQAAAGRCLSLDRLADKARCFWSVKLASNDLKDKTSALPGARLEVSRKPIRAQLAKVFTSEANMIYT